MLGYALGAVAGTALAVFAAHVTLTAVVASVAIGTAGGAAGAVGGLIGHKISDSMKSDVWKERTEV